jgi:dehydrogenase/reductase SDR family member 7B
MSDTKIIWITGASSGIGEELAFQYAKRGNSLVLSARNEKELNRVAEKCKNADTVFVLPLDLAQTSTLKEKTEEVIARFKRIDLLINNGGISQRSEAMETSEEADRKIFEINYFGNVALTKAVVPYMRKQGGGQIAVMSSIAGKFGFFLRSTYSATKHALHGFYESLRLEEEKNNISITILCPGKINTPISINAVGKDGNSHGVKDESHTAGMPVSICATVIISAIEKKKKEVFIGGKEIKAVTLKRFFPKLFYKVIRKQKEK